MKLRIFPLFVVIAMVLCSCSSLEKNDKFALYNLGHAYLEGNGVPKDEKKGFDLLYRSARLGFPQAQLEVGDKLLDTAPSEAFQFYAEAAKQNNIPAHNRLGNCYLNGTGTAKDVPKALEHYKRAADAGDIDSIWQLGIIYYQGEECGKDLQKAFSYFRTLDEKDDSRGSFFVGRMYLIGEWVTQSDRTALFYFRKGANKKDSFAPYTQWLLGLMYYRGRGTSQDFDQAAYWLERAADAGNEEAQELLAYKNGAKPDTSRISFAKRLAMKYIYELENSRRNR